MQLAALCLSPFSWEGNMSKYRERLLEEIREFPEEMMPELYKIIHLLNTKFVPRMKKTKKRGSLKGIWKGSQIDEALFLQAKKSLFPYEYRGNK